MLFSHLMNTHLKSFTVCSMMVFLLANTPFSARSSTLEGVALSTQGLSKDGHKLTFMGAGLRTKKVVLVNIKVYVGELLAAAPENFNKKSPLSTLTEAAPLMMKLHFLRDVDAKTVQSSFKEALKANQVNLNKTEVEKFLLAVQSGGEAKKNKSLNIFAVKKADGTETLIYEDAEGKSATIDGGSGFIRDIFSIWLGTPSDEGVAKLKSELLK